MQNQKLDKGFLESEDQSGFTSVRYMDDCGKTRTVAPEQDDGKRRQVKPFLDHIHCSSHKDKYKNIIQIQQEIQTLLSDTLLCVQKHLQIQIHEQKRTQIQKTQIQIYIQI